MKIALHVCCGVCAAGAASRLIEEGYQVSGLFYNPNIYPAAEFRRRLEVARRVAQELSFPLEAPEYQPEEWESRTGHLPDEPEGGRRCDICYRLRLEQTARFSARTGADAFTTTLTVGPRKRAAVINAIGQEIGGERFLARDFKKKEGYRKAIELAKQWDLYRQHYCGCRYSLPAT